MAPSDRKKTARSNTTRRVRPNVRRARVIAWAVRIITAGVSVAATAFGLTCSVLAADRDAVLREEHLGIVRSRSSVLHARIYSGRVELEQLCVKRHGAGEQQRDDQS